MRACRNTRARVYIYIYIIYIYIYIFEMSTRFAAQKLALLYDVYIFIPPVQILITHTISYSTGARMCNIVLLEGYF